MAPASTEVALPVKQSVVAALDVSCH